MPCVVTVLVGCADAFFLFSAGLGPFCFVMGSLPAVVATVATAACCVCIAGEPGGLKLCVKLGPVYSLWG